MVADLRTATVAELQREGVLLVEDGNHGEYRPRSDEFVDDGVAFIRAADIDSGRVLFGSASKINEKARARITKGIGAPGDVLLSHKGTVGKLALVPDNAPSFVCSPQTTFWRTLNEERLDRRYLFAFLRSPGFRRQLESRAGETDMAPYVSLTAQRALTLTLPSIRRQRAAASILGALDEKIVLNRRMNETLEGLAQTIFKSWFVNYDPVRARAEGQQPVGMDSRTAAVFPTRFVPSELGEIPEGWSLSSLEHHVDLQAGFPFKSDLFRFAPPGLKLLRGSNVAPGAAEWTNAAFWPHALDDRTANCALLVGDIVLAMDRPWIPAGLKLLMIAPHDLPCLLVQRVARLRGRSLPTSFVYAALRQDAFTQHLLQVQTGTTVPHISSRNILSFRVVLPGAGVRAKFDELVGPCFARMLQCRSESADLAAIRDFLLPQLISGELRVPDAEKLAEAVL